MKLRKIFNTYSNEHYKETDNYRKDDKSKREV
jgi:hypothetical protein